MEVQKDLNNVRFRYFRPLYMPDEALHKTLEESLIKHADTVQYLQIYWKPITKNLSRLVNLMSLNIDLSYCDYEDLKSLDWSQLESLSFPVLKILKTQRVPSKSLASLIENAGGHLTEISVDDYGYDDYISKTYPSNLSKLSKPYICQTMFRE